MTKPKPIPNKKHFDGMTLREIALQLLYDWDCCVHQLIDEFSSSLDKDYAEHDAECEGMRSEILQAPGQGQLSLAEVEEMMHQMRQAREK